MIILQMSVCSCANQLISTSCNDSMCTAGATREPVMTNQPIHGVKKKTKN